MENTRSSLENSRREFLEVIVVPLVISIAMVLSFLAEQYLDADWHRLGIYPRRLSGVQGVIFTPFLHANWPHVFNNVTAFFVLSATLIYFYRRIAWQILLISYIGGGILVWLLARESYHIGASGQVYALVAFLFWSGVFRKYNRLMAVSFVIALLYGSLIWGTLPYQKRVSWESHLLGGLLGTLMAWTYKGVGPKPKRYHWEYEDDNEEGDYWKIIDDSTDSKSKDSEQLGM